MWSLYDMMLFFKFLKWQIRCCRWFFWELGGWVNLICPEYCIITFSLCIRSDLLFKYSTFASFLLKCVELCTLKFIICSSRIFQQSVIWEFAIFGNIWHNFCICFCRNSFENGYTWRCFRPYFLVSGPVYCWLVFLYLCHAWSGGL